MANVRFGSDSVAPRRWKRIDRFVEKSVQRNSGANITVRCKTNSLAYEYFLGVYELKHEAADV